MLEDFKSALQKLDAIEVLFSFMEIVIEKGYVAVDFYDSSIMYDFYNNHLSILKKADLIFENRQKNYIYYELNTSVVEEVMLWLAQLKGENNDAEKE